MTPSPIYTGFGKFLTDNPSAALFHADTRAIAKKNGVSIYIGKGRSVNYSGYRFGGLFDDVNKKLSVAVGGSSVPEWLGTYVHESCHMDQWLENSEVWVDSLEDDYALQDRFFSGESVPKDDIINAIGNIAVLEADCEIRSIEKIRKYNLPINQDTYTQLANGYLFFHTAMLYYRDWYKIQHAPSLMGVTKGMSNKFHDPEFYRCSNVLKTKFNPAIYAPCFPEKNIQELI